MSEKKTSENKIHVLMIGPDRSVHGGISAVVNNYYEAGLDNRVDLKYIGTMKEGSKAYKLLVAIKAYREFCHELKWADVVHVNVASDNSFRRKALFIKKAKQAGKKLVIHQHGGDFRTFFYEQNNAGGRKKIVDTLCMADKLIVLSEGWKEFFSEVISKEHKKPVINVLNNTISIPKEAEVSTKLYGEHKLLFLGRICKDKGISELIEAVDTLSKEFPGIHLYLGGIYEDEGYRSLIDKHTDTMTYLGWIDGETKREYLKKCDILVLPSYYEGFPVSVIEGMAYGCAVAATRVGAVPEIIEDGTDGILIEPKDSVSLTEGLRELLSDEWNLERIGRGAALRASQDYNITNTINELIRIYED